MGVALEQVEQLLRSLADSHGVVLHPYTCEPWVIHPFSLTPTNWYRCYSDPDWRKWTVAEAQENFPAHRTPFTTLGPWSEKRQDSNSVGGPQQIVST